MIRTKEKLLFVVTSDITRSMDSSITTSTSTSATDTIEEYEFIKACSLYNERKGLFQIYIFHY